MVPLWVKLLASKLAIQEIVANIRVLRDRMRVTYTTNITEIYRFQPRIYRAGKPRKVFFITEENSIFGDPISIYHPYEINPLDKQEQYNLEHHIKVERADVNDRTLLDQRLLANRVLQRLIDTRDRPNYYPIKSLRDDYERINKMKISKFITKDAFNFYPRISRNTSWRRIVEHYFDIDRSFSIPLYWHAINDVISKKTVQFTTDEIIKRVGWIRNKTIFNPVAYVAILKRFHATDGVIDLHPSMGHKAIACAMAGLKYIAPPCPELDNAFNRGLIQFTGLHYEPLDKQSASVLISDNNFRGFDISQTAPYLDRVKHMIAFAKGDDRSEAQAKCKPESVTKVFTTGAGKSLRKPNYLFFW